MRRLRVHLSQMTFQWLCIVVMAGVILWLIYGAAEARRRAAGGDVASSATRVDEPTVASRVTPASSARPHPKKPSHTTLGRETPRNDAAPQPVVQSVDYPVAAPLPSPTLTPSTALGKESGSTLAKTYVSADDGVYRGKVVRCDGAGGAGPWAGWSNAGTLCLDVGESFIRVKFDGQAWITEPGGDGRWKPTQLEVNDVIRATVNDGMMVRAELLSNIRGE